MSLKEPSARRNYDIHTIVDVTVAAEIILALSNIKDCYQPTNNAAIARCAMEVLHEVFVPDKLKGSMSTEEAYVFLKARGFKVPRTDTVDGVKRLRMMAKHAASDNMMVEQASQSVKAKEVEKAFVEAAEGDKDE